MANKLPEGLPKVALVDSDFLVYRIGFASNDTSVGLAKSRLTEYLNQIVYIDLKADDYEAYITGKTNFRFGVAKTKPYKGNRANMEKPKHYEALREHLLTLGAVMSENCEADDLVAIAASKFEYVVVGQDKDLLQLKGWHYNPIKSEFQQIDQTEADRHFWTQMLTGDRSDNIPCLKGVGIVRATKTLSECKDYSEMAKAVWELYKDKGHDMDYLTEMGRLLWLQRYEGELWEPPSDLESS
jgi:hypothetical protein